MGLPQTVRSFAVLLAVTAATACSAPRDDSAAQESEARIEEAADGLFTTNDDVAFQIEAPFAALFKRLEDGDADPQPAEVTEACSWCHTYSEPGKLTFGRQTFAIRIELRGNSSLSDCPFPKYKVEFEDKSALNGTPFQGIHKFRVNSHCGNGGPNDHAEGLGRVLNEISPIREELVYRLIRAAGVTTYRTRLGKITYKDTSSKATHPLAMMTRYGLLIESGSTAAKRFAAAGLIAKDGTMLDEFGSADDGGAEYGKMREEDIAKIYLAEALVANQDWNLVLPEELRGEDAEGGQAIWNIDVFGLPHKATQLPIPQDFDLTSAVRGGDPQIDRVVAGQMVQFQRRFASKPNKAQLARAVIASFNEKKAAILAELAKVEEAGIAAKRLPKKDQHTTTDPGFVSVHQQIDTFYAQLNGAKVKPLPEENVEY